VKIIVNNLIPFKGFTAMMLFGIMFVRKDKAYHVTENTIRHEKIHVAQAREMFWIFFYLWYGVEWLIKSFMHGKDAYYIISFEREAYRNDNKADYLKTRKPFAWLKHL
jgi:hypothetical protein